MTSFISSSRLVWTVGLVIPLVLFVPVILALPYRSAVIYSSCAECRSTRVLTTRSYLGIPLAGSDRLDLAPGVSSEHVHRWWRYSSHRTSGSLTTLSCKPFTFENDTHK